MRSQWPWLFCISFAALAGAAAALFFNSGPAWAKAEEDRVAELMETVHEYPISPWPRVKAAAKQEPVDWETLQAVLPKFDEMTKALATTKNQEVRELADGYISAVKALRAGATKKDAAATRKAIATLAKTCTDCHFQGGPAGEWEED